MDELPEQRFPVVGGERRFAGDHLIQDHARGIEVCKGIPFPSANLLRREAGGRGDPGRQLFRRGAGHQGAENAITRHLDIRVISAFVQEIDIFRTEALMHHSCPMGLFQGKQDLSGDMQRLSHGQLPQVIYPPPQSLTIERRQGKIENPLFGAAETQDPGGVGVTKCGR